MFVLGVEIGDRRYSFADVSAFQSLYPMAEVQLQRICVPTEGQVRSGAPRETFFLPAMVLITRFRRASVLLLELL